MILLPAGKVERYNNTVKQAWRLAGEDAQVDIMILPSSHSPSVKSVAGNDGGGMRTMPG